jgi:alkanesulfonate monooxygenase SsuD/methylene tetrahydromethanopterin reductase-like flavin-dependent oxidoreductase (luciferase family)
MRPATPRGDRQPPAISSQIGVTAAPFMRSVADAIDLARRADRLGYDSFWVAEVTGLEGFSVLGAASQATPRVGLGTGVSSPVVACDWHGADYPTKPLSHMREFVALLRECLSGNPVTFAGDHYQVRRFRLGIELGERRPKIVLGALGEGMLRLAGQEADGVLLNYLPTSHVPWCVEQVRRGGNATIYANIHVGVGNRDVAAAQARYDLFSYVVVDAYAHNFTMAGFGDAVQAIRAAHTAGDRAGALAAVSDEMDDAIEVVGDEALVRDTVSAYRSAGVDVPVIFPLAWGANVSHDAVEVTLRAAKTSLPETTHLAAPPPPHTDPTGEASGPARGVAGSRRGRCRDLRYRGRSG